MSNKKLNQGIRMLVAFATVISFSFTQLLPIGMADSYAVSGPVTEIRKAEEIPASPYTQPTVPTLPALPDGYIELGDLAMKLSGQAKTSELPDFMKSNQVVKIFLAEFTTAEGKKIGETISAQGVKTVVDKSGYIFIASSNGASNLTLTKAGKVFKDNNGSSSYFVLANGVCGKLDDTTSRDNRTLKAESVYQTNLLERQGNFYVQPQDFILFNPNNEVLTSSEVPSEQPGIFGIIAGLALVMISAIPVLPLLVGSLVLPFAFGEEKAENRWPVQYLKKAWNVAHSAGLLPQLEESTLAKVQQYEKAVTTVRRNGFRNYAEREEAVKKAADYLGSLEKKLKTVEDGTTEQDIIDTININLVLAYASSISDSTKSAEYYAAAETKLRELQTLEGYKEGNQGVSGFLASVTALKRGVEVRVAEQNGVKVVATMVVSAPTTPSTLKPEVATTPATVEATPVAVNNTVGPADSTEPIVESLPAVPTTPVVSTQTNPSVPTDAVTGSDTVPSLVETASTNIPTPETTTPVVTSVSTAKPVEGTEAQKMFMSQEDLDKTDPISLSNLLRQGDVFDEDTLTRAKDALNKKVAERAKDTRFWGNVSDQMAFLNAGAFEGFLTDATKKTIEEAKAQKANEIAAKMRSNGVTTELFNDLWLLAQKKALESTCSNIGTEFDLATDSKIDSQAKESLIAKLNQYGAADFQAVLNDSLAKYIQTPGIFLDAKKAEIFSVLIDRVRRTETSDNINELYIAWTYGPSIDVTVTVPAGSTTEVRRLNMEFLDAVSARRNEIYMASVEPANPTSPGSQQEVDGLITKLGTTQNEEFSNIVSALGKLGPQAITSLQTKLTDSSTDLKTRVGIVIALGEIGDRSVIGTLTGALSDKDWQVRINAVYALTELAGRMESDRRTILSVENISKIFACLTNSVNSANSEEKAGALDGISLFVEQVQKLVPTLNDAKQVQSILSAAKTLSEIKAVQDNSGAKMALAQLNEDGLARLLDVGNSKEKLLAASELVLVISAGNLGTNGSLADHGHFDKVVGVFAVWKGGFEGSGLDSNGIEKANGMKKLIYGALVDKLKLRSFAQDKQYLKQISDIGMTIDDRTLTSYSIDDLIAIADTAKANKLSQSFLTNAVSAINTKVTNEANAGEVTHVVLANLAKTKYLEASNRKEILIKKCQMILAKAPDNVVALNELWVLDVILAKTAIEQRVTPEIMFSLIDNAKLDLGARAYFVSVLNNTAKVSTGLLSTAQLVQFLKSKDIKDENKTVVFGELLKKVNAAKTEEELNGLVATFGTAPIIVGKRNLSTEFTKAVTDKRNALTSKATVASPVTTTPVVTPPATTPVTPSPTAQPKPTTTPPAATKPKTTTAQKPATAETPEQKTARLEEERGKVATFIAERDLSQRENVDAVVAELKKLVATDPQNKQTYEQMENLLSSDPVVSLQAGRDLAAKSEKLTTEQSNIIRAISDDKKIVNFGVALYYAKVSAVEVVWKEMALVSKKLFVDKSSISDSTVTSALAGLGRATDLDDNARTGLNNFVAEILLRSKDEGSKFTFREALGAFKTAGLSKCTSTALYRPEFSTLDLLVAVRVLAAKDAGYYAGRKSDILGFLTTGTNEIRAEAWITLATLDDFKDEKTGETTIALLVDKFTDISDAVSGLSKESRAEFTAAKTRVENALAEKTDVVSLNRLWAINPDKAKAKIDGMNFSTLMGLLVDTEPNILVKSAIREKLVTSAGTYTAAQVIALLEMSTGGSSPALLTTNNKSDIFTAAQGNLSGADLVALLKSGKVDVQNKQAIFNALVDRIKNARDLGNLTTLEQNFRGASNRTFTSEQSALLTNAISSRRSELASSLIEEKVNRVVSDSRYTVQNAFDTLRDTSANSTTFCNYAKTQFAGGNVDEKKANVIFEMLEKYRQANSKNNRITTALANSLVDIAENTKTQTAYKVRAYEALFAGYEKKSNQLSARTNGTVEAGYKDAKPEVRTAYLVELFRLANALDNFDFGRVSKLWSLSSSTEKISIIFQAATSGKPAISTAMAKFAVENFAGETDPLVLLPLGLLITRDDSGKEIGPISGEKVKVLLSHYVAKVVDGKYQGKVESKDRELGVFCRLLQKAVDSKATLDFSDGKIVGKIGEALDYYAAGVASEDEVTRTAALAGLKTLIPVVEKMVHSLTDAKQVETVLVKVNALAAKVDQLADNNPVKTDIGFKAALGTLQKSLETKKTALAEARDGGAVLATTSNPPQSKTTPAETTIPAGPFGLTEADRGTGDDEISSADWELILGVTDSSGQVQPLKVSDVVAVDADDCIVGDGTTENENGSGNKTLLGRIPASNWKVLLYLASRLECPDIGVGASEAKTVLFFILQRIYGASGFGDSKVLFFQCLENAFKNGVVCKNGKVSQSQTKILGKILRLQDLELGTHLLGVDLLESVSEKMLTEASRSFFLGEDEKSFARACLARSEK